MYYTVRKHILFESYLRINYLKADKMFVKHGGF